MVREGQGCWNITLRETGIPRDCAGLVETMSHTWGQVFQDATWLMGTEHPKGSRGPVRCHTHTHTQHNSMKPGLLIRP